MPTLEPSASGTDPALIRVGPKGLKLKDVDSMFGFARCYLQSQFGDSQLQERAAVVIAWAKAAELGLSPLQDRRGMSIINNRVGSVGDLALAMVEASGLLEAETGPVFG